MVADEIGMMRDEWKRVSLKRILGENDNERFKIYAVSEECWR